MSWWCRLLGHSYRPRYDEVPRAVPALKVKGCSAGEFRELTLTRTYVADVCTSCGDVVDARRIVHPERVVQP